MIDRLRRVWRFYLWHQIVDCSRVIGLRDRLRCPECGAVGTWKPHGGWLDARVSRFARRWMCKWCGHFLAPGLALHAFPNIDIGVWMVQRDAGPEQTIYPTPREALQKSVIPNVKPWFG
jgi:hypothetical protein